MTRHIIDIDLDSCIGCHSCAVVCKQENNVGLGTFYNKVLTVGPSGTYPDLEMYYLPVSCQHCDDPECVHVCPTGASYRDENNVVLVDKEKCIGCKYCMMACPYGVRSWSPSEHVVEKCTLCGQLTSVGEEPKCVAACCASARFYGDLDDPNSDASKALAAAGADSVHRLKDVGNGPQTAYILSAKYAEWKEEVK